MTEDYKTIVKDFVAKTLQGGQQGNRELFYGGYVGIARIYDNFDNNAIVKCAKQVVSPKNVGVMWTIIALYSETLHKGRFAILDENLEIVTIIDEYSSGVDIGCYYDFEFDEKGRLYGIEWFNEERVRFIMLNNIAIPKGDTYYAEIRKAYNIPDLSENPLVQNAEAKAYITKINGKSKYGIAVIHLARCSFYTFEIDINEGNKWKEVQRAGFGYMKNPLIVYDNNDMFTCCVVTMQTSFEDPIIIKFTFTETDSTITANELEMFTTSQEIPIQDSQVWWLDNDNVIIPMRDTNNLYLKKLDMTGNGIYTLLYTESYYTNQIQVKFNDTNGQCYMFAVGKNYNAPGTPEDEQIENEGFKESIYHIFNPLFNETPLEENYEELVIQEINNHNLIPEWFGLEFYLIQNQYNLYNHILSVKLDDDGVNILYNEVKQEIYNENNYNGSPYISSITGGLEPKQFILKNDDKILYSRNIYNKTAYGNIIDSSVIIPNNLLNDVEINNEQLWSDTKIIMNDENNVITKNKYEELILNIRNKINIINNNDNQNILLEDISATISQTLAKIIQNTYTNLCIWYAKINYHDDTSENIVLSQTRTDDISTISFEITPEKQVDSIEYISQNNTSYLTITPNLEIGKTYTISQDVRIGD